MGSLAGLPNGAPAGGSKPQHWGIVAHGAAPNHVFAGIGKPPPGRDPRSRQRSKDYLKQSVSQP